MWARPSCSLSRTVGIGEHQMPKWLRAKPVSRRTWLRRLRRKANSLAPFFLELRHWPDARLRSCARLVRHLRRKERPLRAALIRGPINLFATTRKQVNHVTAFPRSALWLGRRLWCDHRQFNLQFFRISRAPSNSGLSRRTSASKKQPQPLRAFAAPTQRQQVRPGSQRPGQLRSQLGEQICRS